MDPRVQQELDRWHQEIEALEPLETQFLQIEANEKPLWSKLFLHAQGKSIAEREAQAYTHPDWLAFLGGLSAAKSRYLKAKRHLELQQARFQSQYLASKIQGEAIQKHPRAF